MGRHIRKISNNNAPIKDVSKLRVVAYCRVSKNADEQEDSLELQVSYYSNLINNHPGWINAGVFADKGSGRNTKNRPAFLELMKLCRKKKVDLILVKSISRFGRNTLDSIIAMRELQELGIDIWFETDNLQLQNKEARMIIEIMAALAQAESESKSQDIKWGIERSYQNPDCKISHFTCYGYDQDENGHLIINKPEAKIVRLIFKLRVEGNSLRKISAELERRKVPSPTGNAKWSANTLAKLLANEKYTGDVVLQKTVVENFFTGVQVKNTELRNKYYIENHHEVIVERRIWNKVQELNK